MKKLICTVLMFFCVQTGFALSSTDIPDEFYINEHWFSLTRNFDIKSESQHFGTVYRKLLSLTLTYEFLDPNENSLAIAKSRFFSLTTKFDIYNKQGDLLGIADENFFVFFPTFDLYGSDGATKLARAKMNFWGTSFTIYDPVTDTEMATMSRSYFRLKDNWTVNITNRALFDQKHIDPALLITVLAFQTDSDYWKAQQQSASFSAKNAANVDAKKTIVGISTEQRHLLIEKIYAVSDQQGLTTVSVPEQSMLATIATTLESRYKTARVDEAVQRKTTQEEIADFTDFALEVVQSYRLPQAEKKGILYLLKTRLEENTDAGHKKVI